MLHGSKPQSTLKDCETVYWKSFLSLHSWKRSPPVLSVGTSTKGSPSDSLKRDLSWPQPMLTASFPPEAPPSLPRVTIACPGQLLVTKQEQYGLLGLLIPG